MSDPFDFDRPRRFAVMGNPVNHSKSPFIHQQFARQMSIKLEYIAIQVDVGGFVQAVDQFRATGGAGLNITVPFKLDAYRYAEKLSDRARRAGAVNTLKFDAQVFGDNTDGVGLVRDLQTNLGVALKGKRVLVLGAGGAVRGVLGPLGEAQPASVAIANRTAVKAKELAADFAGVAGGGFDAIEGQVFDVVINGTAASLEGKIPDLPPKLFAPNSLAYDMMYADKAKPFLSWAQSQGAARVSDGLGMLVEQAAESFFIWHGKRPDTKPVLTHLRASA